jgi:flagellin-like hook-associated protein FlgL
MKTFYALLIAALFTTAACKKKDETGKTEPGKTDTAAKTTDTAKTDTAWTPDPAKAGMAKADTAAGGGMTVDEAGAKITALMEKVGTAVTSANGDCAKMGASLKPLTDEVKALMEQGKSIDKDPAKKKEFDTKYGDKVMKQMEGWMPAVEKCKDNAEVKAFFTSMG